MAGRFPGRWVLGCDTIVTLDGDALGKPADGVEASRMLKRLSGRRHAVISAVTLLGPGGAEGHAHGRSVVAIANLSHPEIAAYVASGEPLDKAGAYAIQGRAATFVQEIRGSHSGIVGLPLCETALLLRQFGIIV